MPSTVLDALYELFFKPCHHSNNNNNMDYIVNIHKLSPMDGTRLNTYIVFLNSFVRWVQIRKLRLKMITIPSPKSQSSASQ